MTQPANRYIIFVSRKIEYPWDSTEGPKRTTSATNVRGANGQ